MNPSVYRFKSIDVFRAITMLLMVFVNDLEPVKHVPEWIKHVGENDDGLGFADTIFPAFLFIAGLSIPFAIDNRLKKGVPAPQIGWYILGRSLALLVMGFFHVNLEDYNPAAVLPRPVWEISITVAFFLIWLDYPKAMTASKRYILQGLGIAILAVMALLYKGGTPAQVLGLRAQWWGILGLIGWSYLLCAGIFLLSKGRLWVQLLAFAFFFLFNLAEHMDFLEGTDVIREYIWIVDSGSMPTCTMAGVIIACLYTYFSGRDRLLQYWLVSFLSGAVLISLAFVLRPYGGISKIDGTPSWVSICTGISIIVFGGLIWLVDLHHKQSWFKAIMPAGTSTLTCYLIPYLLYPIFTLTHFYYPAFMNDGMGGIFRSFLLAVLVVLFTGWLEKKRIRLKV